MGGAKPLAASGVQLEAIDLPAECSCLCRMNQGYPRRVSMYDPLRFTIQLRTYCGVCLGSAGDKDVVQFVASIEGNILCRFDRRHLVEQDVEEVVRITIVAGPAEQA